MKKLSVKPLGCIWEPKIKARTPYLYYVTLVDSNDENHTEKGFRFKPLWGQRHLGVYVSWSALPSERPSMICWDNKLGDYSYFENCPPIDLSIFEEYKDFYVPSKNHFERFYTKAGFTEYYFFDSGSLEMKKTTTLPKEYCQLCAYVQVDKNEELFEMTGAFNRSFPYEGPPHYVWRSTDLSRATTEDAVFVWESSEGSTYIESPVTGKIEPFHFINPD